MKAFIYLVKGIILNQILDQKNLYQIYKTSRSLFIIIIL